jgi:hypothetical protein
MKLLGIRAPIFVLIIWAVISPSEVMATKKNSSVAVQPAKKSPVEPKPKSTSGRISGTAKPKTSKAPEFLKEKPRYTLPQAKGKSGNSPEKTAAQSHRTVEIPKRPKAAAAPWVKPETMLAEQPEGPVGEPEQPAPKTAAAPVPKAAEASKAGAPMEVDEASAWKTYQAESAAAWKKYQAKTISRAEYDAEVKRAWTAYETAAHGTREAPTGFSSKADALVALKTWLQLEFCNSRTAWSSAKRQYGIGAPTTGSGPAFTGLLDHFVRTVASDAEEKRIENELREYAGRDIAEIDGRIDSIQRRLNTRNMQNAYADSWCSKS